MSTTFSYLYLDSRHRNNQSDDDGRANFSLSTPLRSVVSAELVSASIPVSWYTIAQGKNTFELTHSGSTTTITITEGVYTLTTLATAVQSAINTANFTVAVQTTTNRLLFTFNAAFSLLVSHDQLASVLGFQKNVTVASQNNVIRSTRVPELLPPYVSVCIKQLGSSYASGLGHELPSTFLVPCDQNSGSVCNFNGGSHFEQKKTYRHCNTTVSQLDCTLRDQHGDVIDMNGLPWAMVLKMEAGVM